MATILSLFGLLIGLSTVMLAVSLVVMSLVQLVLFLADTRGKTLAENLGSLNQGFRFNQHDRIEPSDGPRQQFVLDVLTYPALHDSATLRQITPKGARPDQLDKGRLKVAQTVEYLAQKDLLAIVRAMLEGNPSDPDDARPLPQRWFTELEPSRRTFGAFREYVEHWYQTLEGVSSEQFKIKARRLTATLSCVVVVVLNLDAIQLAIDLFPNSALQQQLSADAPLILQRAQMLGATDPSAPVPTSRDALLEGTTQTVKQVNGVLNEPALHFGWQNSWIVQRWCKDSARADAPAASGEAPTGDHGAKRAGGCASFSQLFSADTFRWLLGLGFSCLLVSLGAPFWANQLSGLLNFQNSVEQALTSAKVPVPTPPVIRTDPTIVVSANETRVTTGENAGQKPG